MTKNDQHSSLQLFTDGGSRGNPGPGAIGVMILSGSEKVETHAECIGSTTNNRAEYAALICGLTLAAKYTRGRLTCFMDSELVVKQMTAAYRVTNPGLQQLVQQLKASERLFERVSYHHLPRKHPHMKAVDRLLNEALNRAA